LARSASLIASSFAVLFYFPAFCAAFNFPVINAIILNFFINLVTSTLLRGVTNSSLPLDLSLILSLIDAELTPGGNVVPGYLIFSLPVLGSSKNSYVSLYSSIA
jgi:hypothetical protein